MLFKWKTIPGCSFYQVSECGDVRRHPDKRMRGWGPKRLPGSLLHPCYHDYVDKYLVVRLHNDEGKNIVAKVHQLVCLTFNGVRPSKAHGALHKDDNRHNNHRNNLYWGTKKQNAVDREANGGSGTACLTAPQVLWVRELYFGDKWRVEEISSLFEVEPHVIHGVLSKKTYTWVTNGLVPSHVV